MTRRPVYIVDEQKRVTLGSAVTPGDRYDVVPEEDHSIVLMPSPDGRVKVDDRRRVSLGRMARAGEMFRADPYSDGRIVLGPLLVVDPSAMDPDLIASIQDYLVEP